MSAIKWDDSFSIMAALLWGINYVAVKSVLDVLPENSFLLIRFTASVTLLLLYVAITGEGMLIQKQDIAKVLLLGVMGVGLYNIIWTAGIHLTTASNAALIVSTSPLFTQLYMQLTGKEKVKGRRWLFTLIAFSGLFLMISSSPGARLSMDSSFFMGNILVLAATLLFTFYTVYAKPLLRSYSPVKLNALAMTAGLPVLAVYCMFSGPMDISSLSGEVSLKLLYIIVLGTAAAYICWYEGIKKTGPVKVILFHYIVPVSSMILGAAFLNEAVSPVQIAGGILALGGIMAARLHG